MKPDSLIVDNKEISKPSVEGLAKAFEAFSRSSAELIEYYAVLEQRIAELTEQLERSKRLAAIGEMAATLAHEIRNPLAGIELSASMLAKTIKQPSQKEMVSNILDGVRRLNGIISDILCFAQELRINCKLVNFRKLILDVVAMLRHRIEEKSACLVLDLPLVEVKMDPCLMERVLVNLLENAIDVVPEKTGKIELVLERENGWVKVTIFDNGGGVPKEVRDKVFEPFFTTKEKGTGLGLSISQRIVEAHGGRIELLDLEQKTGFRIWLPAS